MRLNSKGSAIHEIVLRVEPVPLTLIVPEPNNLPNRPWDTLIVSTLVRFSSYVSLLMTPVLIMSLWLVIANSSVTTFK